MNNLQLNLFIKDLRPNLTPNSPIYVKACIELADRLKEALEENRAMRAALEQVEWVEDPGPYIGEHCPWCEGYRSGRGKGHRADCPRQVALGK